MSTPPPLITTPTEREIRFERIFNAPRERVWKAFTDPTIVAKWWARGNQLDVESFEVVRGGRWRFVESGPEGVNRFEGRYREVVPFERVVRTWEWDGTPGHVAVESITMEDYEDGRTLVITVMLYHTMEERNGFLSVGVEEAAQVTCATLDALLEQATF